MTPPFKPSSEIKNYRSHERCNCLVFQTPSGTVLDAVWISAPFCWIKLLRSCFFLTIFLLRYIMLFINGTNACRKTQLPAIPDNEFDVLRSPTCLPASEKKQIQQSSKAQHGSRHRMTCDSQLKHFSKQLIPPVSILVGICWDIERVPGTLSKNKFWQHSW